MSRVLSPNEFPRDTYATPQVHPFLVALAADGSIGEPIHGRVGGGIR